MKSYLALRESMKLEDNNGRFTFTLRASLGDNTGKGDVRLAMESMSEIESINEQFQKLSKCMAFVREEADRRMKSVQLRFGFASLPDEILSLVLSYASQCETHRHDTHQHRSHKRNVIKYKSPFLSAVSLSHVCRRLRYVLLGTPEIWSAICDDMSPYAVEACLDRRVGCH